MNTTSEQASQLWCPMARVARHEFINNVVKDYIVGGNNSDAIGGTRVPASCRCIGQQCAMWRWSEPHPTRQVIIAAAFNDKAPRAKNFEFQAADDDEGHPDRYIETEHAAAARRLGHCGLAGRPIGDAF